MWLLPIARDSHKKGCGVRPFVSSIDIEVGTTTPTDLDHSHTLIIETLLQIVLERRMSRMCVKMKIIALMECTPVQKLVVDIHSVSIIGGQPLLSTRHIIHMEAISKLAGNGGIDGVDTRTPASWITSQQPFSVPVYRFVDTQRADTAYGPGRRAKASPPSKIPSTWKAIGSKIHYTSRRVSWTDVIVHGTDKVVGPAICLSCGQAGRALLSTIFYFTVVTMTTPDKDSRVCPLVGTSPKLSMPVASWGDLRRTRIRTSRP